MKKLPTPVAKSPAPQDTAQDEHMPDHVTAEQAASEAAPEPESQPEGTIPARILVDTGRHRCNTLSMLTEGEAASCANWADTSEAAVAYARSLEG